MASTTAEHPVGARVTLHPASDAWMRGDRYGIVERVGRKFYHVRMDSGRLLKVTPRNILGRVVWDAERGWQ